MVASGIIGLTPDWMAAKWVLWIVLYCTLGIIVPWAMTRAWAHQHKSTIQPGVKQLFQHGELGLVGLMVAISVIWDLQKSQYTSSTIALGSVFLAMPGIMAGAVWIESYCRRGTSTHLNVERAWRDSRNLAFLVFSLALVTEILLDRLPKVAAQ